MNLYGYGAGDPINNTDPFGLCPDKSDPKCTSSGGVIVVAISGGAALSTIGANFEAGIAINPKSGSFLMFAGAGNSVGVGASLGLEVSGQRGSLNEFLGGTDMNANASEIEAGFGAFGGNIVLSPDKLGVEGVGVNAGVGGGVMWNLRAATAATKPASIRERLKSLPPISIAPHH